MVLSNSLGTTLEMWEPQVPALNERFGVLRYDHPGHGGSRDDTPVRSVEGLARGVLELLDRARVRARLVLRALARRRRRHVARDARARADRPAGRWPAPRRASACARTGWREPRRCARKAWRPSPTRCCSCGSRRARTASSRHLVAAYRDDDGLGRAARATPAAARRSATGIRATRWRPYARRRSCSRAARIRRRRRHRRETIASRIPGARLSVLEGAGHLANVEEPAAFNRLLLDHLTTRARVEVR